MYKGRSKRMFLLILVFNSSIILSEENLKQDCWNVQTNNY